MLIAISAYKKTLVPAGPGTSVTSRHSRYRPMSTTHPYSTTCDKTIVYDPETGDHAMYLEGELIGFARTAHEAQTTLDQLVLELLSHRSSALPIVPISPAFPLPPLETIVESLGILAAHDDDPAIY